MASRNFLCDLLSNAQKEARDVAVVHAFADGPYDRSSFHFAGCSREMVSIVSKLACDAMSYIPPHIQDGTRHPTVGKVDHISIMPFHLNTCCDSEGMEGEEASNTDIIKNHCVPAAHEIGQIISSHTNQSCQVLYYGYANEEQLPLAKIRKLKTHFFNSSNHNNNKNNDHSGEENDMCIIGVPPNFVENVNIRLRSGVTKKDAIQHVTKYVRSRDGGILSHVEALTLPYGPQQYEVACNLINPNITKMEDVQKLILQKQKENNHDMVEAIYRVGTTVDQCIQVLSQDMNQRQKHNEFIMKQFREFF